MSSTIRILGWKAVGLRCPDHEINCCNKKGDPAQITLIQMPNGTGKTTTLTLLRAALSGAAENWNRSQVEGLRKKNRDSNEGLFELWLTFNNKRLTIILEFNFDTGQVRYKTTWGSGQEDGFNPPFELLRFMNEDFVNFYVFDGELAENFLSQRHTDAEQAVETLFQVHLLSRMANKVSDYWDKQTRNVTAKDETGYKRRKNRLKSWRNRYDDLICQKNDLEDQLAKTERQLASQRDKYDQEIKKEKDRAREIEEARQALEALQRQVRDSEQELLDSMRDPQALSSSFATAMFELKSGLDRVKLPESAAREFFEELAEEKECICGREINDEIREAIHKRSQQYLGSDDVTLLNSMKSAILDAVGQSRSEAANVLSDKIVDLSDIVKDSRLAQNKLHGLKYAAEQSDPDVKKAGKNIDRLESDCKDFRKDLEKFGGKDDKVRLDRIGNVDPERITAIETINAGIKVLEDQVAEVTNTRMLRKKRDILTKIIKSVHLKARHAITEDIRDEANDRIEELMPHNDIRIDEINRCLVLRDQSGGSVGETLSVGYAFLSTLFDRANQHHLPFVVDSPANPIDFEIRPKIGGLVPKLTGQFIAFVISSEREKFLPSLKHASNGNIQFTTLFRKGASHHEAKAEADPSCVTTVDGFRVMGEQFFNEFQLDTEEA